MNKVFYSIHSIIVPDVLMPTSTAPTPALVAPTPAPTPALVAPIKSDV